MEDSTTAQRKRKETLTPRFIADNVLTEVMKK